MKTILQLAIAALLLNACYQAGMSYYRFYSFQDAVELEARRGRVNTTSELHQRVIDMGAERDLLMEWNDVTVTQKRDAMIVTFKYDDEIKFVPRFYTRPWIFDGKVDVLRMSPLKDDEKR
jgi:hypothetical protein